MKYNLIIVFDVIIIVKVVALDGGDYNIAVFSHAAVNDFTWSRLLSVYI